MPLFDLFKLFLGQWFASFFTLKAPHYSKTIFNNPSYWIYFLWDFSCNYVTGLINTGCF